MQCWAMPWVNLEVYGSQAVLSCCVVHAGVVKRVAGLLLAMTGLGALLFYVGLKYAFPNGI